MVKTCASECIATIWGPFLYSEFSNVNQKNEIHECSASGCSSTSYGETLCPNGGTIIIKGVNISYNKCSLISAVDIQPNGNSNANTVKGTLAYSSVVGNMADSDMCIRAQVGTSVLITRTNIIGNTQSMESDVTNGLIHAIVRTDITECNILENISVWNAVISTATEKNKNMLSSYCIL